MIFLFSGACAAPARPVNPRQPAANPRPTATATAAPLTANPDPTATFVRIAADPDPTATTTSIVADPDPTVPASASLNLLPNGRLQDTNGNPSFAGWEQDPSYWCDWSVNPESCGLHRPLPQSPSQTYSLQADRDYLRAETWPGGCCPAARAWTEVKELPQHNLLFFGWEEIHHLYEGVLEIRVFGIENNGDLVEIFLQDHPGSPIIKTKQDLPGVFLVEIPIPEGGYPGYRVEVFVKLVHEFDGILIGDFKLMIGP